MNACNSFRCATIVLALAFSAKAGELTNVVAFTTNFFFLVESERGSLTNTSFRADERLGQVQYTTGTNYFYYRALPFKQAFDFHLFDQAGREVPKTARGLEHSQPATFPKSRSEWKNYKPQCVQRVGRWLFRPDEMFAITNKGVYEMEIRMRICVNMTNNAPDYAAMTDAIKFVRNTHFGVLTSPPVRVRVTKE